MVLNRSFLPIHVTSVRRSFSLVYQGGAKVVSARYETFDFESWKQQAGHPGVQCVGTTSGPVPIPRVIALVRYDRMPRRMVRFSRSNIFSRDGYSCQYCGDRPARSELNLDHVVPRTQSGRTTWENVVCCCVSCNRLKGGRTPAQAGLRLHRRPKRPRWTPLLGLPSASIRHTEWHAYLGIHDSAQRSQEESRESVG